MIIDVVVFIILAIVSINAYFSIYKQNKATQDHQHLLNLFNNLNSLVHENDKNLITTLHQNQRKTDQLINEQIKLQMKDVREQINHSFKNHAQSLNMQVGQLHNEVKANLHQISNEVNKKLNEGFERTTVTFTNVVKRLTIIDEAQKKITELSNHVVDLQSVFQDKRSRGAFGEVQLEQLIQNIIPKQNYQLQYTLSNQKRADCILFLPKPTGNIVIDAKFPLETFQLMQNASPSDKKSHQSQFKQDIKKHIQDISQKYIIKNETAEGAIMFIPAEAIFAEIHANFPELVQLAQTQKVWLASPSTLMAILTTASSVIKDDATKKQVHIVQEHLNLLSKDFARFQKRMDNLSRHINQATQDVSEIHTSAKKISQRFTKIEQLEINPEDNNQEQQEHHEIEAKD